MAKKQYEYSLKINSKEFMAGLQNAKLEAEKFDNLVNSIGDHGNLNNLIEQFLKLEDMISKLCQSSNDMLSDLGDSIKGGYLLSIDQAFKKMSDLMTVSKNIFTGLGEINIQDKNAPKQLTQYAEQLNTLLKDVGIDQKIDLKLFDKKSVEEQFKMVLESARWLNGQIQVVLGNIDFSGIDKGFKSATQGTVQDATKQLKTLKKELIQAYKDYYQAMIDDNIDANFDEPSKKMDEIQDRVTKMLGKLKLDKDTLGSFNDIIVDLQYGDLDVEDISLEVDKLFKNISADALVLENTLEGVSIPDQIHVSLNKIESDLKQIHELAFKTKKELSFTVSLDGVGYVVESAESITKVSEEAAAAVRSITDGFFVNAHTHPNGKGLFSIADIQSAINMKKSGFSSPSAAIGKSTASVLNLDGVPDDVLNQVQELINGLDKGQIMTQQLFSKFQKIFTDSGFKDALTTIDIKEGMEPLVAYIQKLAQNAKEVYTPLEQLQSLIIYYSNGKINAKNISSFSDYWEEFEQGAQSAVEVFDAVMAKIGAKDLDGNPFQIGGKGYQSLNVAAQNITVGSSSVAEQVGNSVDDAHSKLQAFGELVDEIKTKYFSSSIDNVEIGKYIERLDIAKKELDALGEQGLITADQLKTVQDLFDDAKIKLGDSTVDYTGHGNGFYYDNYKDEYDNAKQENDELKEKNRLLEEESKKKQEILDATIAERNIVEEALSRERSISDELGQRALDTELQLEKEKERANTLEQQKNELQKQLELEKQIAALNYDNNELDDIQKENGVLEDRLDILRNIAETYGLNITQKDRNRLEELETKDAEDSLTSKETERFDELSNKIDEADSNLLEFEETYERIVLKLSNGKKLEILPNDKGLRDLYKINDNYGTYNGYEIEDVQFIRQEQFLKTKIDSYEELCKVVQRYNELVLKGQTEGQVLSSKEQAEIAAIKDRFATTKGVLGDPDRYVDYSISMSRMAGILGEYDSVDRLAEYLGIEIPQAAAKAEEAIKEVEQTAQEVATFDTPTGQLSLFEGMSGELQKAEENAEELKDTIKEIAVLDGQIGLDEISAASPISHKQPPKAASGGTSHPDDQNKLWDIERLPEAVENVTRSVDKKTEAFDLEEEFVQLVVESEIKQLDRLEKKLGDVTDAVYKKTEAFEFEEAYVKESIGSEINQLGNLKKKLGDVKSAAKSNDNANKKPQQQKTPNKKSNVEISKNIIDKYNVLVNRTDESLLSGKALEKFEKYRDLYKDLQDLSNKINSKDKEFVTDDEINDFKTLTDQIKEAYSVIEKIRKKSESDIEKAGQENVLGVDQATIANLNELERSMENFAKQEAHGEVKNIEFDKTLKILTYDVIRGDGYVDKMSISLDEYSSSILRVKKRTTEASGALGKFSKTLTQGWTNVFRYVSSFVGFYEIINQIRAGVGYVKDIDTALTELKKVTDETDATYDKFLNTMSKTAGVVGSTVQDLTTMAANWARLGYSLKEAGNLAESTAILLNVSEFSDATEASEALISTIQAFGYAAEDSMRVVDVLNEVGELIARR